MISAGVTNVLHCFASFGGVVEIEGVLISLFSGASAIGSEAVLVDEGGETCVIVAVTVETFISVVWAVTKSDSLNTVLSVEYIPVLLKPDIAFCIVAALQ